MQSRRQAGNDELGGLQRRGSSPATIDLTAEEAPGSQLPAPPLVRQSMSGNVLIMSLASCECGALFLVPLADEMPKLSESLSDEVVRFPCTR